MPSTPKARGIQVKVDQLKKDDLMIEVAPGLAVLRRRGGFRVCECIAWEWKCTDVGQGTICLKVCKDWHCMQVWVPGATSAQAKDEA